MRLAAHGKLFVIEVEQLHVGLVLVVDVQKVAENCGDEVGRTPGVVQGDGLVDGAVLEATELTEMAAPEGPELICFRRIGSCKIK